MCLIKLCNRMITLINVQNFFDNWVWEMCRNSELRMVRKWTSSLQSLCRRASWGLDIGWENTVSLCLHSFPVNVVVICWVSIIWKSTMFPNPELSDYQPDAKNENFHIWWIAVKAQVQWKSLCKITFRLCAWAVCEAYMLAPGFYA